MSNFVTKELLEQLLQEATATNQPLQLAAYIADELKHIADIRCKLAVIRNQRNVLVKQHEDNLRSLKEEEALVQMGCKHRSRTYYGDPAGGSDSYYVCDHCGSDLGK